MTPKERVDVDEMVGACARLALYVVGELQPSNNDVLARDLDSLYELAIAAERRAREEGRDVSTSGPDSEP